MLQLPTTNGKRGMRRVHSPQTTFNYNSLGWCELLIIHILYPKNVFLTGAFFKLNEVLGGVIGELKRAIKVQLLTMQIKKEVSERPLQSRLGNGPFPGPFWPAY